MKTRKTVKVLILLAVAAAIFLLSGCIVGFEDEEPTKDPAVVTDAPAATDEPAATEEPAVTDEPVVTEEPTEEPGLKVTEEGLARGLTVAQFVHGTYTSEAEDFVYIYEKDGKGYMMFDNWGNVLSAGDSYQEPESFLIAESVQYGDADNKVLITLLAEDGGYTEFLLDLTTSDVVRLCPVGGEISTFYYIIAKQYPPKVESMTLDQLYAIVNGLWKEYNEHDQFLDFYESSGTYILEWGKLSEFDKRGSMVIKSAEYKELTEEIIVHGVIAGQYEDKKVDFVLNEAWGGDIIEETGLVDSGKRAYTKSPYNEEDPVGDALGSLLGNWTASSGDFITISKDGDDYYIVLAIWNAGGPFPRAKVVGATLLPSEVPIYDLTVIEEGDTSGEKTAHLIVDRHCIDFTNWYGETHLYYKGDMLKNYDFMSFLGYFERVWYNSDGKTVFFYAENGELYVEFGKEEEIGVSVLKTFRIDDLMLQPSEVLIYELTMYESSTGTTTQHININPGGTMDFVDSTLKAATYFHP